MMFLLDTNACIKLLNGTSSRLEERFRQTHPSQLRLCSVVKSELIYGARKSHRVADNLRLLTTFFGPLQSLPFDDSCAAVAGRARPVPEDVVEAVAVGVGVGGGRAGVVPLLAVAATPGRAGARGGDRHQAQPTRVLAPTAVAAGLSRKRALVEPHPTAAASRTGRLGRGRGSLTRTPHAALYT